MKKKIILSATLAAALAATAACSRSPGYYDNGYYAGQNTAVCVDRMGNRVPDTQCGGGGYAGANNAFLWYYLGRSSVIPYYGTHVGGGSYTRTAGATYFHAPVSANVTRSVAVSRGGLGSSARSYSSARSGGFSGGRGFGSVGG